MDNYRNEFQRAIVEHQNKIYSENAPRLKHWLSEGYAPISTDHGVMTWAILIAVIVATCGAGYFLYRYRSRLIRAMKHAKPIRVANDNRAPGRLRLAGRMFFNLAIAPLLLGGVLIVVAILASRLGFLG